MFEYHRGNKNVAYSSIRLLPPIELVFPFPFFFIGSIRFACASYWFTSKVKFQCRKAVKRPPTYYYSPWNFFLKPWHFQSQLMIDYAGECDKFASIRISRSKRTKRIFFFCFTSLEKKWNEKSKFLNFGRSTGIYPVRHTIFEMLRLFCFLFCFVIRHEDIEITPNVANVKTSFECCS